MLMPIDSAATRHEVNQSRAALVRNSIDTQLAIMATDRAAAHREQTLCA
jgi:hypothetical protein